MAKSKSEEVSMEVEPPKRRSIERQRKEPSERVKYQGVMPLDLLAKLDYLAAMRRTTRSALLEEWTREETRHLVVSDRSKPVCEIEAAA